MKMPARMVSFAASFILLSLFCTVDVQARNDAFFLSIQEAINSVGEAKLRFSDDVRFYFGDQPPLGVETTLAQVTAYKKGSITVKTEAEACNSAFLEALTQLQKLARRAGGDAVINIESYYKKRSFKSNSQYECHAGSAKVGVMLRGDIVRMKN